MKSYDSDSAIPDGGTVNVEAPACASRILILENPSRPLKVRGTPKTSTSRYPTAQVSQAACCAAVSAPQARDIDVNAPRDLDVAVVSTVGEVERMRRTWPEAPGDTVTQPKDPDAAPLMGPGFILANFNTSLGQLSTKSGVFYYFTKI